MSSAALAIENCGPNYKAVFAKPKHEDGQTAYHSSYPRNVDSKSKFKIIINSIFYFFFKFSIFYLNY